MEIEIVKVEITEKKVNLTGKDGKMCSGYILKYNSATPTGLADLKVGDIIEADIVEKDEFRNVKSFKMVGKVPQKLEPKPEAKPEPGVKPVEVSGAERGMATKVIMEAWIAEKLAETHPLVLWARSELNRIAGVKR